MTAIRLRIMKMSPPQVLAAGFGLIIFLGTILLSLPAASRDGHSLEWIDALFTATSATCITGLVVVDTATQFSIFGQIVILILIQLGGLGFMTMTSMFAIALRRRISLRDRLILKESLNQANIEGIVRLILKVSLYSLTIEAIGAILLMSRWFFEMPAGKAVYYGIFHSISLFNNAGFELFGGFRNMTPYVDDWGINIVSILLVILGGIGFIVMHDIIEYRNTRRLSLHSKVVLSATGLLIIIGALVIYIFEYTNEKTLGSLNWELKILASFFQSVSLRSAGINTLDIAGLREGTQFFMVILMFIGAAPGSTGGGIKITTFAILVGAGIAMIRGKEDVVMFRHRLPKESILRATTIAMMGVFVVIAVTMILSTTQDHHFLKILFETTSAFGTVGLSMGLTTDLTFFGKIMIMIMMFVGRLGALSLAYALQPKKQKEPFRYPEGKITIG